MKIGRLSNKTKGAHELPPHRKDPATRRQSAKSAGKQTRRYHTIKTSTKRVLAMLDRPKLGHSLSDCHDEQCQECRDWHKDNCADQRVQEAREMQ